MGGYGAATVTNVAAGVAVDAEGVGAVVRAARRQHSSGGHSKNVKELKVIGEEECWT